MDKYNKQGTCLGTIDYDNTNQQLEALAAIESAEFQLNKLKLLKFIEENKEMKPMCFNTYSIDVDKLVEFLEGK
jgi:hypothetical protein